jgi:hypothetical protein
MQQISVEVHGDPVLFGTSCTCQHGLSATFNGHDHLLPFLVLGPREECPDTRFDRVTRVCVLPCAQGRPTVRLKGLFPPLGWAKQGEESLRDVLKTAAAEGAQYLQQVGFFIHGSMPQPRVPLPLRWHDDSIPWSVTATRHAHPSSFHASTCVVGCRSETSTQGSLDGGPLVRGEGRCTREAWRGHNGWPCRHLRSASRDCAPAVPVLPWRWERLTH